MKNVFRYNKKRKHYAYIYKVMNGYCLNIILTTQPYSKHIKHKKCVMIKNIRLYKHPNPNNQKNIAFIYNHSPYLDKLESLDKKELKWSWNKNDKRKVKRIKKYKKYKDYFNKT